MTDLDIFEAEKKIAQTARRCAMNEATLIWALLGGAISVGVVLNNPLTQLFQIGLPRSTLLGFTLSGITAYFWYIHSFQIIATAKTDYNKIISIKKHTQDAIHLAILKHRNLTRAE